jgi:Ca2+-binding RTX toxin-like protein
MIIENVQEDVNRIIDEKLSEFPTIPPPPPPTGGGSGGASCDGLTAIIVGTDGDDSLVGTNGPDVIVGLGGFDLISGFGGNDIICGNDGTDYIIGGDDDDLMFEGDGNGILEGSDDVVNNDHLDGGADFDICYNDPDPKVNCERG